MLNKQIGFIGGGNMAQAIINGLLTHDENNCARIGVYDINEVQLEKFRLKSVRVFADISTLLNVSDVVFLAVKPQNFETVLPLIQKNFTNNKVIVSIAAGISIAYIQRFLGADTKVVRVMPNTPLLVGVGAAALCPAKQVSDEELHLVKEVFSCSGIVIDLEESLINSATAAHGSGPAYVYLFMKAMVNGAIKLGIDPETALNLVCQTVKGSVAMVESGNGSIDELIRMVTSPNGTTERALRTFAENHFEQTIELAMSDCKIRADELGK